VAVVTSPVRVRRAAAKPGAARSRVRRNAIATAAHDLRTPLDVVIGMTRLLLDTGLDGEQMDHASTILSSAESAVAVLDDLADRASIESGAFALAAASFSPRLILDECARLVMPLAAEKRVAAEYGVDPAVPQSLVGDGARVRRVVFRLLTRIVGATSDGRMNVAMSTRIRPR